MTNPFTTSDSITTSGTVLVTGATGTVGRALVHQLLEAGHRVRALTRDPARAGLPSQVEVVAGDLADTSTLAPAFADVSAAHLITFAGDEQAELPNAAEIVALAASSGIRRTTVLGGSPEPGPMERALTASGLGWTWLCPVEFMANTLAWVEEIRAEKVVRATGGDDPSPAVHEADIAAVARVALTEDGHAGRTYWLTGPEALTVRERVSQLETATGLSIRYVELTLDESIARWRAEGYDEESVEFFVRMTVDPPETGRTVQPTVEQVTGRPGRTFAQWAKENAGAFS